MEESDQIRIARATRASRVRWATVLIILGIAVAVAGMMTYSIRKKTTLDEEMADLGPAFNCAQSGIDCDVEESGHRKAREAKPFLIGGLAGGGGILILGVILLATAPSVPREPVAARPPETPAKP